MQCNKNDNHAANIRKDLLYLIYDFLRQIGLRESAEMMKKESQLSSNIRICDNIDLEIIIQHFMDYHLTKFNKMPKIRTEDDSNMPSKKDKYFGSKRESKNKSNFKSEDKNKDTKNKEAVIQIVSSDESKEDISELLKVTSISEQSSQQSILLDYNTVHDCKASKTLLIDRLYSVNSEFYEIAQIIAKDRLYSVNSEFYEIAQIKAKEIISTPLNVHWDDIYGLDECKTILQEAIIYPTKYPEMFNGKFSSWQGILLYGPPGTGKTMLARAVASECNWTFFNITASSLISKWRGESEKYVRVLCELAKYYAPTIIFIDEIDWTTEGTQTEKMSEPARRFRSELLARIDGIVSLEKKNVALLAATNSPWNLDAALLRRLEKHILVDIPDKDTRRKILQFYTAPDLHSLAIFDSIVDNTEYYSGSDLKQLCKEAWMLQIRSYIKKANTDKQNKNYTTSLNGDVINNIDFLEDAVKTVGPTDKLLVEKYRKWRDRKKMIWKIKNSK